MECIKSLDSSPYKPGDDLLVSKQNLLSTICQLCFWMKEIQDLYKKSAVYE